MATFTGEDLLSEPRTAEYTPHSSHSGFISAGFKHRPFFSRVHVREMLTDPRVTFGLWLIKGPLISNARFFVKTEDEELKKYLVRSIERFWRTSAVRALKAVEWGYSGSEVSYKVDEGRIMFDTLRDLDPPDINVVTSRGRLQGITVRNSKFTSGKDFRSRQRVFVGGPKAFLHVHQRERNPWYGLSRLFGSFVPWWEQWSDGGYRDIRRLWFYKNAYEGGVMYHPPGITRTNDGTVISNKDLAREMIEKKRTGGVIAFPNMTTADGSRAWEYEPPRANDVPSGLGEYGVSLREEILEGMGIPPEVVESSGSEGFGSSTGRAIPQMAFFSTLQEVLQWLISDFDTQILRPVAKLSFPDPRYEIIPFSLLKIAGEIMAIGPGGEPQPVSTSEKNFEKQNNQVPTSQKNPPTKPEPAAQAA